MRIVQPENTQRKKVLPTVMIAPRENSSVWKEATKLETVSIVVLVSTSDAEADREMHNEQLIPVCADAGRYTAFAGSTVGKHAVSTGASICNDCPIGSYNPTVGAAVICSTNCPYAPDGENSCEVCPVGRYVDVLGSVICIGCRVGQYINITGSDEISDCIDCYAGKYVDTTGSDEVSDCIDCNAGKYVVITGASSCLECGAHTYAASQASVPGDGSEFHVASGAKICNSCPAGKYGSADGGWAGICDQELAKSLSMWEEHKKLVGFTCVFVLVVLSLSLGLCWASRRHRAKKQLRDKELDDCSYTDPATGETCTEPNAVVAPGAFSKLAPSLKREGSKKQRKREAQEAERAALQKAWDHGWDPGRRIGLHDIVAPTYLWS